MRPEDRPYKMTIEDRGTYLYVCVESEIIHLEIVVDYINRFARALRETGHRNMIFERRTPLLENLDLYSLAANVLRNVVPPGTRIAVVDPRSKSRSLQQSMLDSRKEAGVDSADFASIEEAEQWLTAA
jgi:hypothetical protein